MTASVQAPPQDPANLTVQRADLPALYQSASDASQHGQRWYRRLVVTNLGLLVTVATLSGITFLVPDSWADGFMAVIVFVLLAAMAANFVNWRRGDDENWFDGRAVAESVKTSSWRYMMRTEPFDDDATCNQLFIQKLRAILDERKGLRQQLDALSADPRQITERMREMRRLGVRRRLDVYVRQRLDNQITWYHAKAQVNERLSERWFWASFGAEFVCLVIALSTVVTSMEALNLVGIAAALAVAFTAWTQLGRHNELNKSYGLAWQELVAIKDLAESTHTEQALQELVRAGEDAISREHTMWVAKRG